MSQISEKIAGIEKESEFVKEIFNLIDKKIERIDVESFDKISKSLTESEEEKVGPESVFNEEILNWIKRESEDSKGLGRIHKKEFKNIVMRLSLRENMGTGLMFDLIMRILKDYVLSFKRGRDGINK